jgi:hypothetical protein
MEASLLAGDMQRVALCLNEYAWGAWDAGDSAMALGRWDECVGLLRQLGERAFLGSYLLIRGFARIRAGHLDTARGDVIEGAELTGQVGAIPDVITAVAHAADWLARVGHRDRAVAHLVAADQIRSDHGIELDRVFPMAVVPARPWHVRGRSGAPAEGDPEPPVSGGCAQQCGTRPGIGDDPLEPPRGDTGSRRATR